MGKGQREEIPAGAGPSSGPPDFTAEWTQIREDLDNEATGALRVGQALIRIKDALKPLGLWLQRLREHGMSQPQASRYIRYAELPERDRALYQRVKGFSLTEAVGERREKSTVPKATEIPQEIPAEILPEIPAKIPAEIPADELADRRAEVDRRLKLAVAMIEAGEVALAQGAPLPEYVDDTERWLDTLREVATDVLTVIHTELEAKLKERLPLDLG